MIHSHRAARHSNTFPPSARRGTIRGMSHLDRLMLRLSIRPPLIGLGGLLLGFGIATILRINNQWDKMFIAVCCAAPLVVLDSMLGAWECMKAVQREQQEEADEWNRAVNAGLPNPDDKSESS